MPPNPPSNAHGEAMRSMSLRDMQIPKSKKKISWPPPSQILGTPLIVMKVSTSSKNLKTKKSIKKTHSISIITHRFRKLKLPC